MVLLGYRIEDVSERVKKTWYLLQNTWKTMPLLEVSAKHLQHNFNQSEGKLIFILGEIHETPKAVDICGVLFLEASFNDGGEEAKDDYEEDDEVRHSDLEG